MRLFLIFFLSLINLTFSQEQKPYVIAEFSGQLGNNLFEVASACALAWDNDAEAYFPDLANRLELYHHVFSRFKINPPSPNIAFEWKEPSYAYHPIPFHPNMLIKGYFQSEKYFARHRGRLLQLLAPIPRDLKYMQKKYQWLFDHPNTVGVQIRYYHEDTGGCYYNQYGKDYLDKAMALFPEDALFIISSNNKEFARKNIPPWVKNFFFLEEEAYYIDFYLLTFCKHNIITNSSYGWWTAWLNQNPNKIVVRPSVWINGLPTQDVCPENWVIVNSKLGRISDPESY